MPTDVALFIVGHNSVSEFLVDGNILRPRRRFVEILSFGSIWDGVMQAWPENLMTELVIALREFSVRNPDRQRVRLNTHPCVDSLPKWRAKLVRRRAKNADPKFAAQPVRDAVDCVAQTTVAVVVRFDVPLRSF